MSNEDFKKTKVRLNRVNKANNVSQVRVTRVTLEEYDRMCDFYKHRVASYKKALNNCNECLRANKSNDRMDMAIMFTLGMITGGTLFGLVVLL